MTWINRLPQFAVQGISFGLVALVGVVNYVTGLDGHEVTKGDHTFIAKPVDIGELRKSIADHIRR